jgi:hypothetical protein
LGSPLPVLLVVVCNSTDVFKLGFDLIAGWQKATTPDGVPVLVPGRLPLFSNVEGDRWVDGRVPSSWSTPDSQLDGAYRGDGTCRKTGSNRIMASSPISRRT